MPNQMRVATRGRPREVKKNKKQGNVPSPADKNCRIT